MTTEQIAAMVGTMAQDVKCEFNYLMFPENSAPEPPYILFYYPNSNDFKADNINYSIITQLNIELYTPEKDFEAENAIESILKDNEIVYQKSESYLDSEQLYEVLYIMEVVLNE